MDRLIFINRYYWPEETATAQLLTDLAEGLASRGRSVTVVTRRPGGPAAPESRNGVRIVHVDASRLQATGMISKAVQFASFWRGARRTLQSIVRAGDGVIALTDPPLMGIAAEAVAHRRGATAYHWIQDIYPEVAEAVAGGAAWSLFRPMRDRAWRRAAACVTLGADMASLVAERGVPADRLHVQPNWAPAGLSPAAPAAVASARAAWGVTDQFVVGYSGNLGRVHDLDAVLALAESLREDRSIRFQITGSGPQRARVEAAVRERGLSQVAFAPPAPRELLAASLAGADLHLVTLRAGCERCVFPSKLYGIAAVGRPALFLGPPGSEIARLIEANGIGASCSGADLSAAQAVIRAYRDQAPLRQSAGAAALRFGAAHAGPKRAIEFWDGLARRE